MAEKNRGCFSMICIFVGSFVKMKITTTIEEIGNYLSIIKREGHTIGFVPTMGALHNGHLALIERCRRECTITVCSIFVNPLQFNVKKDFIHYPVTIDHDINLLSVSSCDVLFHPEVKEMYPDEINSAYDFGILEQVMEGKFRPGHFGGVATVVKRLFEIIRPDRAYFGEKDYQQLIIIRKLVALENMNIEIVPCEIVREPDGLAMSSRNVRLTPAERNIAPYIYQLLKESVSLAELMNPEEIKCWMNDRIKQKSEMRLEYYELSDVHTLQPIMEWEKGQEVIACVAVFLGEVRLIDNIRFFS